MATETTVIQKLLQFGRAAGFLGLGAAMFAAAGCASSSKSFYKTTLADPHPYPFSVIRTAEKPQKQPNGTLRFTDQNGTVVEIPEQYIARIERQKLEADKNERDLVESRKPKAYKPTQGYFLSPFEFR
jgi:hypothetical protein